MFLGKRTYSKNLFSRPELFPVPIIPLSVVPHSRELPPAKAIRFMMEKIHRVHTAGAFWPAKPQNRDTGKFIQPPPAMKMVFPLLTGFLSFNKKKSIKRRTDAYQSDKRPPEIIGLYSFTPCRRCLHPHNRPEPT